MVTVEFFGLIRSNHRVKKISVKPGTLQDVVDQIIELYPTITVEEIKNAVLFINGEKVMHLKRFFETVKDGDTIFFTNFVGGG